MSCHHMCHVITPGVAQAELYEALAQAKVKAVTLEQAAETANQRLAKEQETSAQLREQLDALEQQQDAVVSRVAAAEGMAQAAVEAGHAASEFESAERQVCLVSCSCGCGCGCDCADLT